MNNFSSNNNLFIKIIFLLIGLFINKYSFAQIAYTEIKVGQAFDEYIDFGIEQQPIKVPKGEWLIVNEYKRPLTINNQLSDKYFRHYLVLLNKDKISNLKFITLNFTPVSPRTKWFEFKCNLDNKTNNVSILFNDFKYINDVSTYMCGNAYTGSNYKKFISNSLESKDNFIQSNYPALLKYIDYIPNSVIEFQIRSYKHYGMSVNYNFYIDNTQNITSDQKIVALYDEWYKSLGNSLGNYLNNKNYSFSSIDEKLFSIRNEQDKFLSDQNVKEQQRLANEARAKEQQRFALEASELSSLRAEVEESKRKQAELEEQLRLAKLQNQVTQTSAMTTMANRKALVIGNDTYKSVTKLLNAREDAKAIASNLTAVGYKVSLQLDLNEKEMKAALRTFTSQVQGGDEVMFFFAGHGVQLGAANYLLPTDIGGESEAQVKDEGIQLQRVLDDMTEKKAKFTLAMIDACRDNPFKSAGRNIGGRGLAPTTAATGQMVVFSAGTGQQALDRLGSTDKNKNGVFTRTFLKEMQKSGFSIDRIVKNVRNEVAELAKTVGHEQVPAIYDQVLGDFYFKR